MEIYDYDEFFVPDDDPGVEVLVPLGEKRVPIKVKRKISTADSLAAENAAVTVKVLPSGKISQSIDQSEGAVELLHRCILSWPFTKKKVDGQGRIVMDEEGEPVRIPVPITRENIKALLGEGSTYLYMFLRGMLKDKQEALQGPFESPSGVA